MPWRASQPAHRLARGSFTSPCPSRTSALWTTMPPRAVLGGWRWARACCSAPSSTSPAPHSPAASRWGRCTPPWTSPPPRPAPSQSQWPRSPPCPTRALPSPWLRRLLQGSPWWQLGTCLARLRAGALLRCLALQLPLTPPPLPPLLAPSAPPPAPPYSFLLPAGLSLALRPLPAALAWRARASPTPARALALPPPASTLTRPQPPGARRAAPCFPWTCSAPPWCAPATTLQTLARATLPWTMRQSMSLLLARLPCCPAPSPPPYCCSSPFLPL